MSLSTVLNEIRQVKPLVDEDITEGPRETYAGREGRQRNAKDRYKILKEDYTKELRLSAAFIIVVGSAKEQFQEIAKNEFNCFTSDPEDFYKDLANRLPEELYKNKVSASNLFDIVGRHLEDKANELGIIGYPQLIMKAEYQRSLSGKEDFVALIKQAINAQVGSEIVGIHTAHALTDQAIKANHESKLTPIVMITDDEALALDLNSTLGSIGSRSFLVVAGKGGKTIKTINGPFLLKEVDSESVKNVLTNISKMCKNR